MLSESQERMLLIVRLGREAEVQRIFEKWDLHAVKIGQVTEDALLRVRNAGEVLAEIPNKPLADEAPLYDRPYNQPADLEARQRLDLAALDLSNSPSDVFLRLMAAPGIASKQWIYRQYDHMVRTNTIVPAGAGAGVVRIKGTSRALAFSVDGNGRYCYLDPYQGAMLAVAEAARNVACVGGQPIGATNCLNFGNPERSEIMWQFAQAVSGIGDACRALDVPITGGNVSLYNETDGHAILPTPVIGVVGTIEDAQRVVGRTFQEAGAVVMLLGATAPTLGGSEYLKVFHGLVSGLPPTLDLEVEYALQRLVVDLVGTGTLQSANDCSDGGLAVALAECMVDTDGVGCEVMVPASSQGPIVSLFGEASSQVVVSVRETDADRVAAAAAAAGVPSQVLGSTGGSRIRISVDGKPVVDVTLAEAAAAWTTGVSRYFEDPAA